MNLRDALDSSSDPVWPGKSSGPVWPGGQPAGQPSVPGGWPSASPAGQPSVPGGWPSASPAGQPSVPGGWPSASPAGQPSVPGGWPSPSPAGQPSAPGQWPSPSSGPAGSSRQQSLAVPFKQDLPGGVYDKLLITIAGIIKPHADKFTVDLVAGQDLAFHFNPRFNENGRKVIVRNTRIGSTWGCEERQLQHFPFVQGQPFEMKILCTNTEYKVAVNNSHLLTYRHRITNLRSITNLRIYYDLTLTKVLMETLP